MKIIFDMTEGGGDDEPRVLMVVSLALALLQDSVLIRFLLGV